MPDRLDLGRLGCYSKGRVSFDLGSPVDFSLQRLCDSQIVFAYRHDLYPWQTQEHWQPFASWSAEALVGVRAKVGRDADRARPSTLDAFVAPTTGETAFQGE